MNNALRLHFGPLYANYLQQQRLGRLATVDQAGNPHVVPANLGANPHVKIEIKDRQFEAEAEVASSEKRKSLWSQLISLSPAYANYIRKTTREIPLVSLRPLKNG